MSRVFDFIFPKLGRAFGRARERYLHWRHPEPTDNWRDANDDEQIRLMQDRW